MSNPGEFLQACAAGLIWVYCESCAAPRNLNAVENLDCIGNEAYWGDEPWWHDIRVFRCPACGEVQRSRIEYQP